MTLSEIDQLRDWMVRSHCRRLRTADCEIELTDRAFLPDPIPYPPPADESLESAQRRALRSARRPPWVTAVPDGSGP